MLLRVVLCLAAVSFNLFYHLSLIEGMKPNKLMNVVYVSKHRGEAKEDCGSKLLPCKTLQVGLDKLAWGGQLYVDGENTQTNPYKCESSSGKLMAKKSLSIQSYTKENAHISCESGFIVSKREARTHINITGVWFKNTVLYLTNAEATIQSCTFLESSPAIYIRISKDFPTYSLEIQNTEFSKNRGCIYILDEYSKFGKCCNHIVTTLREIKFRNNTFPTVKEPSINMTGLVFIKNEKSCCCEEVLLFSMWENVEVTNNYVSRYFYRNYSQQNEKYEKYSQKDTSDKISESLFVADVYGANLSFLKVRSENNKNIRFLTLRGLNNSVNIENSYYHGHHIGKPGGVLHFKGIDYNTEAFVNLTIIDSVFLNNSGTLGGVLQIDSGKKHNVVLNMTKVRILYSYGSVNGCVVSVGSVARIFAKFDGLDVYQCHNPVKCTTKPCRKRLPAVCLEARATAKITIENSNFTSNKNQALRVTHTSYGASPGKTLDVTIKNTNFTDNAPVPGGKRPTVDVLVYSPSKMKGSSLNISQSVFRKNRELAILVRKLVDVYVSNFTCIDSGTCFKIQPYRSRKPKYPARDSTLHIENSKFIKNKLPLSFINVKPKFVNISIKDTMFHKNHYETKPIEIRIGEKGMKNNSLISGCLLMDGVSFTDNYVQHTHANVLGIMIPPNKGNFTVVVQNSFFVNNFHRFKENNTAFSNLFYFYIPHFFPPKKEILSANSTGKKDHPCPPFTYRNKITFKNVTFENNSAFTSTLFVSSGNVSFRSCLFKNNFSFQPEIGTHLYVQKGATSANFYDTKFIQTKKNHHQRHAKHSSMPPLLFYSAQGPLKMRNTSFKYDLFVPVKVPMFILERGHIVQLDNDTTFVCPVGSYLKLHNITFRLNPELNEAECDLTIRQMRLSCNTCPVNAYTLQSGYFRGTQKHKVNIDCLECPFGANCKENIQSRPNFWGYKTSENPPTLLFEKCPEGYCRQPGKSNSNFSIYNKCAGNRTGTMCGACKPGYTENMFNHNCCPVNKCRDSWFWVIAGLYSVIMAIFVLCQPSLILFLFKKTLWFKEKESSIPNSRVDPMRKTQSHDRHAYFKIIFYFYQVAELLMIESCSEILPQFPLLSIVTSFYNFQVEVADPSFGCPFPGLTAVTKELFRCLQVFATMVVIVVFYFIHWLLWSFRKRPTPLFAPYLAAIIEVLLLGYERLGYTSFKLLTCTPLDMLGKIEWRLVLDGNITCWVHWWQFVMIYYNIVFVVPFLLVLYVGTSKLKRQEISACHFVASCFVPLPFLVYWMLRLCCRCDTEDESAEDPIQRDQEKRDALLGVLQGPFRPPDSQSRGALYWESVLIGRRLIMLCLFSFVAALLPRLLCMTFMCTLILIHSVVVMPYKDRKANIFALVLLFMHVVLATINLAESVIITAGIPPKSPLKKQIDDFKMLEVFLLSILPCAFVLLVVAVVISQTVRLIVMVGRYCWKDADDSFHHSIYQPLLNYGDETRSLLH